MPQQHQRANDRAGCWTWLTLISFLLLGLSLIPVQGERTGAIARDGWRSNATGRGACSHHGGVARWTHEKASNPLGPLRIPLIVTGVVGILILRRGEQSSQAGSTTSRIANPQDRIKATRHTQSGSASLCPICGGRLVRRKRRRDGHPFMGCSNFPRCRHTRSI